MKINKIDYYVGALLSYLINKHKHINPSLFDSSEKSKNILFETDNDKYNLFVKYSSKPVQKNQKYSRWDITITPSEYYSMKNGHIDNYQNYFVVVCSNVNLKKTDIAIIPLNDAFECMGDDDVNENRRISIKIEKKSKYIQYYGTAISDKNARKIVRNIERHFN